MALLSLWVTDKGKYTFTSVNLQLTIENLQLTIVNLQLTIENL
jgi:hypothetical protein